MTAQPVTVALPNRLFVSTAATVLLLLAVAGTLTLAGLRLWNMATGSATIFAAFHTTVVDSLALIGMVLALGLVLRLVRGPRTLGRRRWLPHYLERRLRRLIEVSIFGVAPLVGWDAGESERGLAHLLRPASEDRVGRWLDGQAVAQTRPDADLAGPSRGAARTPTRRAGSAVVPVVADGPIWEGPVHDHVVQRGDTFWSLAERIFDDGERWAEIAGLNLGREVDQGVFFESDMSLRRGWTIAVPRVDNPAVAKSQARRGLIR